MLTLLFLLLLLFIDKSRSPGPFAYRIKDTALEILPPHIAQEEFGSRSVSRGGSISREGSTKMSQSGRDFFGSIYYDEYNKPTPSSNYNSNAASRCVSTTIPSITASFAPSVCFEDSIIEARQERININNDPVRRLHSSNSNTSRGGSRGNGFSTTSNSSGRYGNGGSESGNESQYDEVDLEVELLN